jgi:ComF family protein
MYAEPLVSAILVLKYQPNRQLVARMAGWLHELVARSGWVADVVIPVPLAPDRLRQRGYNQAGLLAASLAQRLHLPEDDRLLQRVRATSSQVGLTPVERRRNVSGAFLGEHRLAQGKHVLIVDDLCTTGATLSECAMALYHAGSKEVRGVTVARA